MQNVPLQIPKVSQRYSLASNIQHLTSNIFFSICCKLSGCVEDVSKLRQVIVFKRWRIGYRRVDRSHPDNRCIKPFKCFLPDCGGDFAANSAGPGGFVQNHHLACLLFGCENGLFIHWRERTEVYHLDVDAFFFQLQCCIQRCENHRTKGDDRQIPAFTRYSRFPDFYDVVIDGQFFPQSGKSVELLVLKKDNRTGVANRRLNQPLRIVRSGGFNNLQTRRVQKKGFSINGMEWSGAHTAATRAAPHAAPTIAASDIGVSITRPSPNSSSKPSVTLNAPPYDPTSSPMTKTVGSRSISSQIPCRIASTKVATPPRSGRFDLCSFLIAVDIQYRITIQ